MFCEKCGHQVEDNIKFCAECGAPIQQDSHGDIVSKIKRFKTPIIIVVGLLVLTISAIIFIIWGTNNNSWNGKRLEEMEDDVVTVKKENENENEQKSEIQEIEIVEEESFVEEYEEEYDEGYEDSEPIEEEFVTVDENEWKQAYIKYLYNLKGNYYRDSSMYALANIDDDEIPELHILGEYLCSYYNGELYENYLYADLFYYIEKKNLCLFSSRRFLTVCRLENGRFLTMAEGNNTHPYDINDEFFDDGAFFWNETEVSEEEYFLRLKNAFDVSLCKERTYYTFSEIITKIENYPSDNMETASKVVMSEQVME